MIIRLLLMGLALTALYTETSLADSTFFSPIGIGIVPPVQFPPQDFAITGARISVLYGVQRNVYGFDVAGIGNNTQQTFAGVAVAGVFNLTNGTTTAIGLQFAGITNINNGKTHVAGVQAALGLNYNSAEATVAGLQVAFGNYGAFTTVYGVELGVFNRANTVNGFQIGVVNVATNLHGIQIGVLNFNQTGLFAVSPIINFGF